MELNFNMKTNYKFLKTIFLLPVLVLGLSFCTQKNTEQASGETAAAGKKEKLWVYTSMYKDTIADMKPYLEKTLPDIDVNWFQAGSEEIASKVNAELLAGNLQADVLISSDRFWYEELANQGRLHPFTTSETENIPQQLRHPNNMYAVASLPVMVLAYNKEVLPNPPQTFKALANNEMKGKVTTGSPLDSGTNFTTMAMLQFHYGWDFFKSLKSNDVIAQGGNSSVLRRIQSGERPIGWVLLENVLRIIDEDKRLGIIYPEDGVVTHANVMAITKKGEAKREAAEKFAEWIFSKDGQEAMTRSYMYSPLAKYAAPKGAPELNKILSNAFPWNEDFIQKVTADRVALKEKYTEIMF